MSKNKMLEIKAQANYENVERPTDGQGMVNKYFSLGQVRLNLF